MTGPQNSPYRRRFANPADRPSNMPFAQWAAAETRRTIKNFHDWLDAEQGSEVVAAAELITHAEAVRRQRMLRARTEGWRAGEPGE